MDSLHIKELVELALSEVRILLKIIICIAKSVHEKNIYKVRSSRKSRGKIRNGREGGRVVTWGCVV
jgi:hypothetical protein